MEHHVKLQSVLLLMLIAVSGEISVSPFLQIGVTLHTCRVRMDEIVEYHLIPICKFG